jgi:hypothetical protein
MFISKCEIYISPNDNKIFNLNTKEMQWKTFYVKIMILNVKRDKYGVMDK